ncbi:ParB/RepB/Spo0J family partition protein [Anaerotignum sp.]
MKSPAREIKMTSYDDLFNMNAQNVEESVDKIVYLPLLELHTPKNHPFKVNDDAAMQEMTESVKQSGVLSPGIARPLENGGYELLAGNRRKRASELAGLDQMPIIVKNLTDDEAIILMVDSNLQREELLPSEKAFAYKLKLDAMKRQGIRNDLTLSPMATKLDTAAELGKQSGESRDQVFRYIRLTELTPDLLELVDEKKIAFRPAVELSYLTQDEQRILYDVIDSDEVFPSIKQAQDLRHYSKEGRFNADIVMVILNQEKPIEHKITLDGNWVRKRFPKSMTPQQIKDRINKALDLLEKTEKQKQQREAR